MKAETLTPTICQGYHWTEIPKEGDRPDNIPTSTDPFNDGWGLVRDLLFHPQGHPVFICPACVTRYQRERRMTEIEVRMLKVVGAAVHAFGDYQKDASPTAKGRTASATSLIQSIGLHTTNIDDIMAKIGMLLGTDGPITGADVIQALTVDRVQDKKSNAGYPGTGPWRI